jgi:hypothetical protein
VGSLNFVLSMTMKFWPRREIVPVICIVAYVKFTSE